MSVIELKKSDIGQKRLVQDDQYYKHIFKKTEKIVCAVLYIFKSHSENKRQLTLVADIEDTARATHNTILLSLNCHTHQCSEVVENCAHALLTLDSKLRLGHAAELVPGDVLHVLTAEIEGVMRSVSRYLDDSMRSTIHTGGSTEVLAAKPKSRRERTAPKGPVYDSSGAIRPVRSRRDRILDIIIEKGEVAIKDISDIITDCSEKTIQRELNDMIKDEKISKTGERRWSRYSIK